MRVFAGAGALLVSLAFIISCKRPESKETTPLVRVSVNKWNANAEREWQKFVHQLGIARARGECIYLQDCLRSEVANSLGADPNIQVLADCADLPIILRAYFAYKTKRQFRWVTEISGGRYSNGNKPTKWKNQTTIRELSDGGGWI